MKKIVLTFSVLLLAIAVMVASFAWFANNMQLKAENTTLTAGKDISMQIVCERVEEGKFNGETGKGAKGDEDAPYSVAFSTYMENQTLNKVCNLVVSMERLIVTHGSIDTLPYLVDTKNVSDEFTWRFTYLGEQYMPDASGLAVSVLDGTSFEVPEGRIQLTFNLIYLSEDRYIRWKEDCDDSKTQYDEQLILDPSLSPYFDWVKTQTQYFNYAEFLYSHPSNMNTTFYFDFKFSIMAEEGNPNETP